VENEKVFFKIVKRLFSEEEDALKFSEEYWEDVKEWLDKAGIEFHRRPETLSMEEFARLADTFDFL
jgi:16S rRNA (adenine1518-N6/adenine1519-N6)-dimethyltransferase